MSTMDDMFELEELEEEGQGAARRRSGRRFNVSRMTYTVNGEKRWSNEFYVRFKLPSGRWAKLKGFEDETHTRTLAENVAYLAWLMHPSFPQRRIWVTRDLMSYLERLPDYHRRKLAEWGLMDGELGSKYKTLVDRAEEWEAYLIASGNTERYAKLVSGRVKRLLDGAKIVWPTDLKRDVIVNWLSKAGFAPQTRNYHVKHLKQFVRWLNEIDVMQGNPVAAIKPVKVVKTMNRRTLSAAEVKKLIRSTRASQTNYGKHDGRFRALVYSLAIYTGLRANEIRQLKVRDLHLVKGQAKVVVRDSISKNRQTVEIPISDELAGQFREYIGSMNMETRPFPVTGRTAAMLRRDLEAAKIPEETAEGTIDFHALRHTFVTLLALKGVPVPVAQKLDRHSTPVLTMNLYTKVQDNSTREAIKRLPGLPKA